MNPQNPKPQERKSEIEQKLSQAHRIDNKSEIEKRLSNASRFDNWKKFQPDYENLFFPEDRHFTTQESIDQAERRDNRCKAHAVYSEILNLINDVDRRFVLADIFDHVKRYRFVRPKANTYKVWHEKTVKRMLSDGVFEVLKPKPSFGNKSSDDRLINLTIEHLCDKRKLSDRNVAEYIKFYIGEEKKKGNPDFASFKMKSIGWVTKIHAANRAEIDFRRNGATANRNHFSTPIKNKKVENSLDRVEMDATILTFPYWNFEKNRAETMTTCLVVDCFSGRIIGFSFGRRENAELYMKALNEAFERTNAIPFELVYDRFPGHNKEEAQPFLNRLKKIGVVLNMNRDGNPRHKPTVEKTVDGLCELARTYHNFVGKNITTKNTNSRRSIEYQAKITRSPFGNDKAKITIQDTNRRCLLKDDAIIAMTQLITEYNSRSKGNEKLNRIEKFKSSNKPNSYPFSLEQKIWLFHLETTKTVENGLLIFYHRFGDHIRYKIPGAQNQLQYRGQKLKIRYTEDDLLHGREIYVYDMKDDLLFVCLPQEEINVNAIDRTPQDYQKRVAHNKEQKEKRSIILNDSQKREKALEEYGLGALEIANHITNSKEQVMDAEEAALNSSVIRQEYNVTGGNLGVLQYIKDRKARQRSNDSKSIDMGCEVIDVPFRKRLDRLSLGMEDDPLFNDNLRLSGYDDPLPLE
jgi:hypothetical protein